MTLKERISSSEFIELKKKYPHLDLKKVYDVVPDEEYEKWKEFMANFEVPEFLKK